MKKDFYVYVYYRLDTNEPFYVGKGKDNRWKKIGGKRNKHFKNIVNSTPIAVEIVKDNLTEEEAHGIECYLIHELVFEYGFSIDIKGNKSSDGDWLHLASATWGGEGISGYKFSEESIKKKSGVNNGNSTKVVLLNTLEIFDTMTEGANKYNISSSNNISLCCSKSIKSCGKDENGTPLVWRYYEDYLNMTEEEIKNVIRSVDKRIILLNTLEVFDSTRKGAKAYGTYATSICQCCNGKAKSSGKDKDGTPLVWKFYVDYLELQNNNNRDVI